MEDELSATETISEESQSSVTELAPDFNSIPPILVLPAHLKGEEACELEGTLRRHGAPLTSDVSKVKVFIGKVGTKRRAEFELRSRKLKVEEITEAKRAASAEQEASSPSKRRKLTGSQSMPTSVDEGSATEEEYAVESGTEDVGPLKATTAIKGRTKPVVPRPVFYHPSNDDVIWVIRTDGMDACISSQRLLPLGDYLVYKARVLERPATPKTIPKSIAPFFSAKTSNIMPASHTNLTTRPQINHDILERAKSDVLVASASKYVPDRTTGHGSQRFEGRSFASSANSTKSIPSQTAHLLQQTTSEYEGEDSDLPPPPEWVKKGIKYACQRFTPANGPNEDFIALLKKIRTARTLIDDETGVRAYSTIIATIAAYPHKLRHPREVLRLPGCDIKAAELFVEWKNTGRIRAVDEFDEDEAMKVLRSFYDIWGVGAKTARQFYYGNHWTEIDDIVEYGWNDLDRVQQIGVKYYDEFLDPIPRAEVEQIAEVVRQHAIKVRDERVTVTIVGGYRRGKLASGDVDMIVSHPELEGTAFLVRDLVESLEEDEWITHTLTMSLNNTNRGQATLPFRTNKAAGVGFDTLDKALVVWQDPNWPTRDNDLAEDPRTKNPNIHRRVDIIISPWRTVGCAVAGWTSGTTFQRDLRRCCKAKLGWKFDSSGVRDRNTGEVVQLEGPNGVDGTPEEAERKVFEGLRLEYVPPEMRCTN